ncbi:CE1759 family FMN reductase [Actinotalea fermentans]|uniref:FMN reductase n=1 Tax=Actinotalea fermentans TaxID=43671 RepID=A0A511Z1J9_9CELL|nr:CE1759 family FMN reductase [Actinotalea fermentans]KGM16535.1 NADPH-dependent FMN reductase [Actinotalea fermentans ATCC 43279 = JCM 9966 = DSM 3133]GEN81321.1 FMN reductase [Actinotalea fermentans]
MTGRREATIAVVSAGVSEPSSTRLLADRLGEAAVASLAARGIPAQVALVDVRLLAQDLTTMLLTGVASPALGAAMRAVTHADGLVAVSPIYSGSYNGLFKTFFDLVEKDALADVPVLLGATAGTARHSLAIEHALRPLFAYLGAVVAPTGVFAATDDFGHSAGVRADDDVAPLADRVAQGGAELARLVAASERRPPADPFALTESFEDLLRGQ